MQKKYLFILTLLFNILLVNSCNDGGGNGVKEPNGISQPEEDSYEMENPKSQNLLLIADDRSGSTGGIRKMTEKDYLDILKSYAKKHYGQVAIRVIGNPVPQEQQFYLLELKKPHDYLPIPEGKRMSIIAKVKKKNEQIKKMNQQIDQENVQKIEKFVNSVVKPHIINYKPYKNKDITNIKDVFEHIYTKTGERTFDNYDKIQLLIISDGIHDATKLKEPLKFKPDKNKDKLEIFLVGWKDKSAFDGNDKVSVFESIESFKSFYRE